MRKYLIATPFVLALIAFILYPTSSSSQEAEQASCDISINRSAVPELYFDNLTLLVQVNDAADLTATHDGQPVAFSRIGPQIMITTNADSLTIVLTPGTNLANLCDVEKAPLLNNKEWAWSHGFDDNVGLLPSIEEFRAKSWPATIFAIAKDFSQTRNESWIVDEPFVNSTLLPEGWALGNHSWNHERFDTANPTSENHLADILDGQTRFVEGIARSSTPNFKVMVFASPNFSSKYDEPFTEATQTTDLRLLETGNDFMLVVTGSSSFSAGEGLVAQPLAGRTKIGRDIAMETNAASVIERIDWMATHTSEANRFWYNTLAHGNHELKIKMVLDHVWNNYGPGGSDEAWVASSTEIYSYILVRDNATIAVETSDKIPENEPVDELDKIYLPIMTLMRSWLKIQAEPEQQDNQVPSLLLKVSGRGMQELKASN